MGRLRDANPADRVWNPVRMFIEAQPCMGKNVRGAVENSVPRRVRVLAFLIVVGTKLLIFSFYNSFACNSNSL